MLETYTVYFTRDTFSDGNEYGTDNFTANSEADALKQFRACYRQTTYSNIVVVRAKDNNLLKTIYFDM